MLKLHRVALLAALVLPTLTACDPRDEAMKDVIKREIVPAVAADAIKEQAKAHADKVAKQILEDMEKQRAAQKDKETKPATVAPGCETARIAYLEALRKEGMAEKEARRSWVQNYDRIKKAFVDRLMKETGASAEKAEDAWHHGWVGD